MSTHFIFPKPRDWEAFEDIVCDVFSRKYQTYNLQRYGRRGQTQYGVDIVGPVSSGLLGIQCKHHPNTTISTGEVDREVSKSEAFRPPLNEFIIATSSNNDAHVHQHVLQVSESRKVQGKYPVSIKFWDDIYNWLTEYPDLLYKHFTKYFPVDTLETIHLPGLEKHTRHTLRWPTSQELLRQNTAQSMKGISQIDPYNLAIGITTFPDVSFTGHVDVELQLAELFSTDTDPQLNFQQATTTLNDLRMIIADSSFSRKLTIYPQVRLTLAFLIGWVFRRVTHYELSLVHREQVWATTGFPYVPSKVIDGLPDLLDNTSEEVVLVLNITRDIKSSVVAYVDSWEKKPKAVLSYSVEGHVIRSGAHALSVARDIARKIKNLVDVWHIRGIHLFPVMPAALATLISYHLNAICPISIYFLQEPPTTYKLGGVIQRGI